MITIPIHSQKNIKKLRNPVVAIGVFDGVHRGHQKLITKTIQQAKKIKGTSVVLTFFPHPVQVLNKKLELSLLMSLTHRLKIIENLGVDVCFVVHFTKQFARLTAEDFIEKYLACRLNAKEVFIGKNFHFGKNRNGNSHALKVIARKYNIHVNILPSVCFRHHVVSSSRLRALVKQGNLLSAKRYLGRDVSVFGEVAHGDRRGIHLGFPTANINSGREIVPPNGVYIVKIVLDGKLFQGVANIGHRPSFKKKSNKVIEVHIFNFNKNIYGKNIEIKFLKKVRDEKKFLHPQDLCAQVAKDKDQAMRYFSKFSSSRFLNAHIS
jgi:riboflavin kinase/FMN adenylyltransferase